MTSTGSAHAIVINLFLYVFYLSEAKTIIAIKSHGQKQKYCLNLCRGHVYVLYNWASHLKHNCLTKKKKNPVNSASWSFITMTKGKIYLYIECAAGILLYANTVISLLQGILDFHIVIAA
jgi:hypothetical protein